MATRQTSLNSNFHKLDFSTKDRDKITKWVESHPHDLWKAISTLTDGQCKISISYSQYYDCYYVSLTCKDEHSTYYDHTFAISHNDLRKAIGIIMYVFSELMPNKSPLLDGQSRDLDW
jgi:hypothetical protein